MRADKDVDLSFFDTFERFFLFLRRAETVDDTDAHAEFFTPRRECLIMLLCQHGRRYEDGDLFSADDCLERGADGDFRFAEADITAQKSIHRLRFFHIALDLLDGAPLVDRFFIRERIFKLSLPRRIFVERDALFDLTFGIERDKLLGDIDDCLACARFGTDPVGTAHARQLGRVAFVADIFLERGDLIRRHIQLIIACVTDMEIVFGDTCHRYRFDTDIFTDTVAVMYDIIADVDLAENGDAFAFRRLKAGTFFLLTEDIAFRYDDELSRRDFEPLRQRTEKDEHFILLPRIASVGKHRADACFMERAHDAARFVLIRNEKCCLPAVCKPVAHIVVEKVYLLVIRGDTARGDADKCIEAVCPFLHHQRQIERCVFFRFGEPLVPSQKTFLLFIAFVAQFLKLLGKARRFVDNKIRIISQIRKERVDRCTRDDCTPNDLDFFDRSQRALRFTVEHTDRIYLIVKKFDTVRVLPMCRIHINDTAAHAELACAFDTRAVLIACFDEQFGELLALDDIAFTNDEPTVGEGLAREHLLR